MQYLKPEQLQPYICSPYADYKPEPTDVKKRVNAPDTVVVENERELFEAYTGRVVIRTIQTKFDGTTDDILASGTSNSTVADYIGVGGEQPKEGFIKLIGKGIDVTLGGDDSVSGLPLQTFIQGYRSFENGRLETVIVAQLQDVDSRKVLFSEAGTA